ERLVRGAAVGYGRHLQGLRRELPGSGAPRRDRARGAEHRGPRAGGCEMRRSLARRLTALAAAGVAVLAAASFRAAAQVPPPNIIFIFLDDSGYGDTSVYGQRG